MRTRNASGRNRIGPERSSAEPVAYEWAESLAPPSTRTSSLETHECKSPGSVVREDGEPDARPPYQVAERARAPSAMRTIRGPDDVYDVCPALRSRRWEEFHILLLNARHEVQRRVMVSRGSLNASIVHPREVFRPAILASAASVVLVHNHPSGDPEPSDEDLAITRRLAQVGELLGIAVLDHVVIGKRGFVSLRARGHI